MSLDQRLVWISQPLDESILSFGTRAGAPYLEICRDPSTQRQKGISSPRLQYSCTRPLVQIKKNSLRQGFSGYRKLKLVRQLLKDGLAETKLGLSAVELRRNRK
jgi:hypothetical protein